MVVTSLSGADHAMEREREVGMGGGGGDGGGVDQGLCQLTKQVPTKDICTPCNHMGFKKKNPENRQ